MINLNYSKEEIEAWCESMNSNTNNKLTNDEVVMAQYFLDTMEVFFIGYDLTYIQLADLVYAVFVLKVLE